MLRWQLCYMLNFRCQVTCGPSPAGSSCICFLWHHVHWTVLSGKNIWDLSIGTVAVQEKYFGWTQDFPSTIRLFILSLGPTDEIPFICSVMNVTKIGCRGIIFPSPSSGCSASKGRRCNATERSLTHLCVRRRYTSVLCADVARKSAANRLTWQTAWFPGIITAYFHRCFQREWNRNLREWHLIKG